MNWKKKVFLNINLLCVILTHVIYCIFMNMLHYLPKQSMSDGAVWQKAANHLKKILLVLTSLSRKNCHYTVYLLHVPEVLILAKMLERKQKWGPQHLFTNSLFKWHNFILITHMYTVYKLQTCHLRCLKTWFIYISINHFNTCWYYMTWMEIYFNNGWKHL